MLVLLVVRVAPAFATASVLSASPVSWDFGNGDIHSGGGPTQTFSFTNNTASTGVNVSKIVVIGADASEFQLSADSCSGAFLPPTGSCSVQVTFHATSVGANSASLELTDDTGTLDVPLSGTGITGTLSANPNPVNFQPQPWFDGGQQQGIAIQDSPDAGVQSTSMTITGPDASLFYIAGGQNCANQLYSAGSTCFMELGFNPPNGPGVFHAQLVVSSDSLSSPLIVPLTAAALSGPTAVVSPAESDFGSVALGSSASRTVTISNSGDSPLQVQGSFMVGSPSTFPVLADGCSGQPVDPGSSCQMTVGFQPSAVGYRQATLIVLTNTPNPNVVPIAFSGTGVPTLAGAATITGTAAAGSALTCNPVGYPAGTSYQYRWLRNGQPIAGANTPAFVPLDANVGQRLACRLTSTNSVSQQTVTSPASAPIAPMTLSNELGAFTAAQTCRAVQVDHLLRVGRHTAIIRYGQPVTPWAPLTVASTTALQARVDGPTLGRGKTITITPRALSALADGIHKLTITAANKTTASQLLLAPCQLALRLQGGPGQPTTLSASGRYGITRLTFHLPRQMHLHISPGRNLGSATYVSATQPPNEFPVIGPRTSSNNVNITLTPHTITITNLPIQTGVINIALRAGVVAGHAGTLTATAKERGSSTPQTASTPTSWIR